ncbi:MAG: hypothetical protein R3F61_36030 [Myxococcota bacterium]
MFKSVNPDAGNDDAPSSSLLDLDWAVILIVGLVVLLGVGGAAYALASSPDGTTDLGPAGARGLGKIIAAVVGLGVTGLGALAKGSR